jgi:tetratricopeptide (TPR) repeat protein
VSRIRFFGIICLSTSLYAQILGGPEHGASSEHSVTGELRSHGDTGSDHFLVEVYDIRSNTIVEREPVNHGQFELNHVPVGSFSVRLVTAPGEDPIVEQYHEFEPGGAPLVLDLPERAVNHPISGLVSVRDLQHPIPKKAIRAAYEAQQLSRDNNLPKAIAKLESAIRIDPEFRDAHLNLGVEYTRVGRTADARAEFQRALDIGPPAVPICIDLALTSLALHQNREAEAFARKALQLDPDNAGALRALKFAQR